MIEVLSWSFSFSESLAAGTFDATGVAPEGTVFTIKDAPNPAVVIVLGDQFGAVTLEGATLDYNDDGSVSIDYVLADGTGGNIPIEDANFNDIKTELANIVDDGDVTPTTIVPTDADFLI